MGEIWKDNRNDGSVTPEPGRVDRAYCGICCAEMNVERSVYHEDTRRNNPCDLFTCPYLQRGWHKQAACLKDMIRDTPSANIAKLLQDELDVILIKKKPTKDLSHIF